MAWVRFVQDMDWRVGQSTIAYKAGWTGNAPTAAADAAVTKGRAVRLKKANRCSEPVEAGTEAQDGIET